MRRYTSHEWFEAQVYGKPPFSMYVPSISEQALREHLAGREFEVRTMYRGVRTSAYATCEIASEGVQPAGTGE